MLDRKCLWIPICATFYQVLPRTDLHLCINEHGELALIALPEHPVSTTWGKICEHLYKGVALKQRLENDKDESFLAPLVYTEEQKHKWEEVASSWNSGKLFHTLKRNDWHKIVLEIKEKNITYLNNSSYWQRINRFKFLDKSNAEDPDQFQTLPDYTCQIPIFLYTEQDTNVETSRLKLQREMFARQLLSENNIDAVRNALKTSPSWSHINENDAFVHVINRVETELKLNSRAFEPSFSDIMLNPEMSEFIPGPPPVLKLTPKGLEASGQAKSHQELGFSISNWGEPDIAHVALHIKRFESQSPKESVTSPAITVFRDEMGIHTLQSRLFSCRTSSFSLGVKTGSPVNIDSLLASQIPEINWKLKSGNATSEWWAVDKTAKKVLWLAARNLTSHVVGNPEEVIYSVTPIGKDVIQVAIVFDNLEEGVPYAFAIIKDEHEIIAVPVFTTGTYESLSDGALITKGMVVCKNYCITRAGERIDMLSSGRMMQFIKPIYTTVISGKYKTPTIYTTH